MGLPPLLAGLKVVTVEQAVAAPYATRQLADLGARVLKVERPDGGDFARRYDRSVGGESSYFVWLNRGKESVALDLSGAAGQEVLHRLLAEADVFVTNLGPGAARRRGLDTASLAAAHPQLITCTITGYGSTGPWATRKAYDLLIQSEVGLVSVTGTAANPSRAGISVADIAAGMHAYSGVLCALLERATTGAVRAVEVSLFEALAEWMAQPLNYTRYGGTPPARTGGHHATIAPYGPFATADGEVLLAIQNEREWQALCRDVLGAAELASDPRFSTNAARVEHRKELHEVIDASLARMDTDTAVAELEAAAIACARPAGIAGLAGHPVLAARGRWQVIGTPAGPVEALVPPVDIDGLEPCMGDVPAAGQHTAAILAEHGFTAVDIARLVDVGVAGVPAETAG